MQVVERVAEKTAETVNGWVGLWSAHRATQAPLRARVSVIALAAGLASGLGVVGAGVLLWAVAASWPQEGASARDVEVAVSWAALPGFASGLAVMVLTNRRLARARTGRRRRRQAARARADLTRVTHALDALAMEVLHRAGTPYGTLLGRRHRRFLRSYDVLIERWRTRLYDDTWWAQPGAAEELAEAEAELTLLAEQMASLWRAGRVLDQDDGWRQDWEAECLPVLRAAALTEDEPTDDAAQDVQELTDRLLTGRTSPAEALTSLDELARTVAAQGSGPARRRKSGELSELARTRMRLRLPALLRLLRRRDGNHAGLVAQEILVSTRPRVIVSRKDTQLVPAPLLGSVGVTALCTAPFLAVLVIVGLNDVLGPASVTPSSGSPVAVCVSDAAGVLGAQEAERLEQSLAGASVTAGTAVLVTTEDLSETSAPLSSRVVADCPEFFQDEVLEADGQPQFRRAHANVLSVDVLPPGAARADGSTSPGLVDASGAGLAESHQRSLMRGGAPAVSVVRVLVDDVGTRARPLGETHRLRVGVDWFLPLCLVIVVVIVGAAEAAEVMERSSR